jgi:hypothetical protein
MADQRFTVHGNTPREHMDLAIKRLNLQILQIFYKDCNGHAAHELILIPKEKEEHGKVGGKI